MSDPWEEQERHEMQAEWEDAIVDENDRLRKLCADMWRELAIACAEQVTSHETLREFSDRMRELGVSQ